MARRNGTGPDGKGPNTGRGLGPCKTATPKKTLKPVRRNRRLFGRNSE